MNINYPDVVNMTVTEFKAFKRGVRILIAAGMTWNTAVETLLLARREKFHRAA